jgi:pimeloyl-ACP methyl ester carboxylesterase
MGKRQGCRKRSEGQRELRYINLKLLAETLPVTVSDQGAGPAYLAAMAANQTASMLYAGAPFMHDPGLRERLAQIRIPTLVLWGANDRIVTPAYGQRFANSIPNARFELIDEAGHFPQIERLDSVLAQIEGFRG